jgi:hypothetical protein
MVTSFFALGAVLAVLSTLSLLAKNEGVRGGGRVIGGGAWLAIGVAAWLGHQDPLAVIGGIALVICGLVTLASGARKFMRRNTPQ